MVIHGGVIELVDWMRLDISASVSITPKLSTAYAQITLHNSYYKTLEYISLAITTTYIIHHARVNIHDIIATVYNLCITC